MANNILNPIVMNFDEDRVRRPHKAKIEMVTNQVSGDERIVLDLIGVENVLLNHNTDRIAAFRHLRKDNFKRTGCIS